MPFNVGFYQRRVPLFDGASGTSSTYTSSWHFAGDYQIMSLSWTSSDGGASRLTVQASNEDGLRSSIVSTSNMTTIVVQGVYTVDPGVRWIRAQRSALDSLGEVFLQART